MSDYDHSIQRFKDRKKDLEAAEQKRHDTIELLRYAIEALNHPTEFGIAESGKVVQARFVIDKDKWPSIQKIDEVAAECRKAKIALEGAFYALPNEDKELVTGQMR